MGESIKTDKITRILILYHQLIHGQHINKALFSWEHGINERSFDRDIEDLRLFLSEIYSTREVLFDRESETYFMTGDSPVSIDRIEATIIGKILLDSKTLRTDEMSGLYNSLLKATLPRDASAIREYLLKDIERYYSDTKTAVLKTVGDLYVAIESGMDLEVSLHTDNNFTRKEHISPLTIDIRDSCFVLVAAKNMDMACVTTYPIEDIESFTYLKTRNAFGFQQRESDNIHKNIETN